MQTTLLPLNEPGRFYTLDTCEGCGQCQRFAPLNVKFDPSEMFCYVYRQPATEQEIIAIQRALVRCPVRAMNDTHDCVKKGME